MPERQPGADRGEFERADARDHQRVGVAHQHLHELREHQRHGKGEQRARFGDGRRGVALLTARRGAPAGIPYLRHGAIGGGAFNFIDQNIFGGKIPVTLHDDKPDYACLKKASEAPKIDYPKPDGKITFDRLSSVFVSNTNHNEHQPAHLTLKNASVPVQVNLAKFGGPESRYCPAGVYEFVKTDDNQDKLVINAQNCVHCKTCDIKDPTQNIVWVTPEGGGGPNYAGM